MVRREEEYENSYYIPKNYSGMGRIAGRSILNWIEAVMGAFLVIKILSYVPFTVQIKIVVIPVCSIIVFLVCMIGIKRESLTTFLIGSIRYARKKGVYSFRRPDEVAQMKERERLKKERSWFGRTDEQGSEEGTEED